MPHCNTILKQILNIVPRHEFESLAKNITAAENSERQIDGASFLLLFWHNFQAV